jgi:hypothetical protein
MIFTKFRTELVPSHDGDKPLNHKFESKNETTSGNNVNAKVPVNYEVNLEIEFFEIR